MRRLSWRRPGNQPVGPCRPAKIDRVRHTHTHTHMHKLIGAHTYKCAHITHSASVQACHIVALPPTQNTQNTSWNTTHMYMYTMCCALCLFPLERQTRQIGISRSSLKTRSHRITVEPDRAYKLTQTRSTSPHRHTHTYTQTNPPLSLIALTSSRQEHSLAHTHTHTHKHSHPQTHRSIFLVKLEPTHTCTICRKHMRTSAAQTCPTTSTLDFWAFSRTFL